MFIDSHCHIDCIDLNGYQNNINELMKEVSANNVEHMLCVCIDLYGFDKMYDAVKDYAQISVSAGMHPTHAVGDALSVETILQYASKEEVVAVGETGLDYFYQKDKPEWQKLRFRHHISAAKTVSKPVIVHTREAQADTLKILKEESVQDCGGVIHCFTEDWAFAKAALDQNLYISFSGIATFKTAEQIREVIRKVPENRFLIETDSPYLAPVPMRGKQNQPGYVKYVAECVANERNLSVEEVAAISKQNFYNFLKNK
ncbi:MAG: YchF/TatD family DNA exonuclease [Gammaproteobacteria bacterium]|nr:YchF/TatD family DNA exonuclease [Gammaproteobacteria bacterium]